MRNARIIEVQEITRQQTNDTLFRQTYLLAICVLGFLLLVTSPSHALVITHTNVYSNSLTASGAGAGANFDPVIVNNYNSFDASLGTLEDIKVSIHGDVIVSGVAGASFGLGGFGTVIPVSYTLDTNFGLNIGGFGSEFFGLSNPLEIGNSFSVAGSTGGIPIAITNHFSFSFDYNDLLSMFIGPGSATCSGCNGGFLPPFNMTGSLDSFISDNIFIDQLLLSYDFSFLTVGQAGSFPTSVTANSVIFIDTTYTYSEPTTGSVPEPPVALLLCSGLIVLALRKARQGRQSPII